MKQKQDTILNVILGGWGCSCYIMGKPVKCNRKARFMVCGRDGKPMLSRLEATVCAVHLPLAIRRLRKMEAGR